MVTAAATVVGGSVATVGGAVGGVVSGAAVVGGTVVGVTVVGAGALGAGLTARSVAVSAPHAPMVSVASTVAVARME